MEITFLGGASEVGRLGMVMRDRGGTLLFDYGMLPEDPPRYPLEAPPVDMTFLTHGHLDHCGMIPWIAGRYEAPVVATGATISTADILWEDSIKVAKLEGLPAPFDMEDVRSARRNFREARLGDTIEIGAAEVTLHSAGHIPGSCMYGVNSGETTLFTGDLQTINTELMWGAHPEGCDTLIMESTYAGRSHPNRETTERGFLAKVKEVVDRGGTALVPCFAVARTQEILLSLARGNFDVWLDGMGKEVNRVYLRYPDALRSAKKLRQAMEGTKVVRSSQGRERAARAEVVVTTSGMLDGGPAIFYLERLAKDPRHAILLTGYQLEGTNGRSLLESGYVEIKGARVSPECEVEQYDFSAHAGHDELVKFVDKCNPERVLLMHGDRREDLARALEGREVILPMEGKPLTLSP